MHEQTPADFLKEEWFLRFHFADSDWILGQPSSSALVFLLSALAIFYGLVFLKDWQRQESRRWCGVALVLSGFAAAVAGIYYQAFGYQIRCSSLAICASTSLWESLYLSLSSLGVMAFVIAVAFACLNCSSRRLLIQYAWLISSIYNVLLFVGIHQSNSFLTSYDFSLLFTAISILLLCGVNGFAYVKNHSKVSLLLLYSYLILFATSCCYYAYFQLHFTEQLWVKHIWLSQNDILHLGMIIWVRYIAKNIRPILHDFSS